MPTELTRIDDRQGTIVQMKFFGGLSSSDISTVLGISLATVDANGPWRGPGCVAKCGGQERHELRQLGSRQAPVGPSGVPDRSHAPGSSMRCAQRMRYCAPKSSILVIGWRRHESKFPRPRLTGGFALDFNPPDAAPLAAGQLFAHRFLLMREPGQGGMGRYGWPEIEPLRRQVAWQRSRPACTTTQPERFRTERQSPAITAHPPIAKVVEAGATPPGQPYRITENSTRRPDHAVLRRAPTQDQASRRRSGKPAMACSTRIKRRSSIAI